MSTLRSAAITAGVQRAPNRAMLRAVGFGDADFGKPIIGIANGYSTITPCNAGLDVLADRAEVAVKAAGAMPQVFGTITVSDGISMGTEGMKYSLVSREVIADSIETACGAESMDGVVAIGGCDKNMPGAMIAIARMNIPAIFVYGGTIKPGRLAGRDLTVVSAFEAVGQFSAGRIGEKELLEVERHACPGKGSCGGMFTANTMSSVFEAMGMSLPGSSTMAAEDAEKAESAARSGEVLVNAVRRGILPRAILTRQAFENGISVAMALGGSTNAVLHLLAIAHSAGVPLALDDFEAIRARVPVLCDLKPSGRYVATDLHAAGGVPQVMKMLLAHGLLHGDALTITGETIAESLRDVPADPRADQDVIRPWARPLYAQGHLAVLRGNLAPEGAVAKITGVKEPRITGPARVFESEEACLDAILAGRIRPGDVIVIRYEGPRGRTRYAGDAGADLRDHRRGAGRFGRPDHRRTVLGRHLRARGRPRRARGGGGWAARARRGRRPHHDRRPRTPSRRRPRRGRARPPARRVDAAGAPLHRRRAAQVRPSGLEREPGRGDGSLARRRSAPGRGSTGHTPPLERA